MDDWSGQGKVSLSAEQVGFKGTGKTGAPDRDKQKKRQRQRKHSVLVNLLTILIFVFRLSHTKRRTHGRNKKRKPKT